MDHSGIPTTGWQIGAGFAGAAPGSLNFYAIYEGAAYDAPERGTVAVIARGETRMAAELVARSFIDGYFSARRTLSARRAVGLSLTSINNWVAGQKMGPVSLAALVFCGVEIGVVQAGVCQLYRQRDGELTPLRQVPGRQLGEVLDVSVTYQEEAPKYPERFILVAGDAADFRGLSALPSSTGPAAAAGEFLSHYPGEDVSIIIADVISHPAPADAVKSGLAGLPLRPKPREGDVWDGFVIGKTLYHGRYTVLKAAHDTIENREVALKIPLPAMLQDEIFTAGFMREAWIGSTVRGASVVRYIELPPERRSSLYLVMPLYRGETLESRLHRTPPLALPEGLGIALKLCEAVQDLAAIQIIHRDIKPENIMLLTGNEIRLLDLGLAYLPGIDMQDAVKPGGTVRYMAPELLRGVQANARTEVYALAVTIYRMFSRGAYPFGQREPVPLARLRPDLPAWLGRCLQIALKATPEDRYADAGALARALIEGLTNAVSEPLPPRRRLHLSPLQFWRGLALLFGAVLLSLALRALLPR